MPNYNLNQITARRSYSINEIAHLLDVNRRTCGRWIKHEGLKSIGDNTSNLLIMGMELKDFIKKKRNKRKIHLKDNEFFCLKCHKAVKAKIGSEQIVKTGKKIGKDNQEQLKRVGVCENCETKVNKFLGACR